MLGVLLRVLGIEPPKDPLDVWSLTDIVAFSRDTHGCSIVDAISAARENARGATIDTATRREDVAHRTALLYLEAQRVARGAETSRQAPDGSSSALARR